MRTILFLLGIFMISCSADPENLSDTNPNSLTAAQADSALLHSLPENASVALVTGHFDFQNRDDFVRVADSLSNMEIFLQEETYQAFEAMADQALKDGVRLIVVSGTRNFQYQKSIWDRKWAESEASTDINKAREILLYSSMPMTSRHHWGTEVDLNNLNNSWFEEGEGKVLFDWLQAHANDFGFYQPYTDKSQNNRTGYEEEKWHWSYMPLAGPYLDFYNEHVTNEDITGFEGSGLAPQIDMVGNYVNGLSDKIRNY